VEWDRFTSALKTTGISLNDNPDALRWVGGDATGIISVKNIYIALLDHRCRRLFDTLLIADFKARLYKSSNLAQVGRPSDSHYLPDSWLGATELALSGREAVEWDRFTSALKTTGITLNDNPDALRWVGGDATGIISVKNIYIALLSQQGHEPDSSWFTQLWIGRFRSSLNSLFGLQAKGNY
jgi:hypothetical protein